MKEFLLFSWPQWCIWKHQRWCISSRPAGLEWRRAPPEGHKQNCKGCAKGKAEIKNLPSLGWHAADPGPGLSLTFAHLNQEWHGEEGCAAGLIPNVWSTAGESGMLSVGHLSREPAWHERSTGSWKPVVSLKCGPIWLDGEKAGRTPNTGAHRGRVSKPSLLFPIWQAPHGSGRGLKDVQSSIHQIQTHRARGGKGKEFSFLSTSFGTMASLRATWFHSAPVNEKPAASSEEEFPLKDQMNKQMVSQNSEVRPCCTLGNCRNWFVARRLLLPWFGGEACWWYLLLFTHLDVTHVDPAEPPQEKYKENNNKQSHTVYIKNSNDYSSGTGQLQPF